MQSAFYSEQCLAALGVGSKAGVGLPEGMELHQLVPGMSRALNGKVAEGRASSRRALLRCVCVSVCAGGAYMRVSVDSCCCCCCCCLSPMRAPDGAAFPLGVINFIRSLSLFRRPYLATLLLFSSSFVVVFIARHPLLRSRKAMGLGAFEAGVAAALERTEASALLAALATPNRTGSASKGGLSGRAPILHGRGGAAGAATGGKGGGRPSIREQMMAARRKKEETRGGERKSDAAGDGFVVVT